MNTHNLYFEQKYEKKSDFFLPENFHFLVVKFSIYLNTACFCNDGQMGLCLCLSSE